VTVNKKVPVSFTPRTRSATANSTSSQRFDGPIEVAPVHDPGNEKPSSGRLEQSLELL
jgi:hypothetical protein